MGISESSAAVVDVLILTALEDELQAVLALAEGWDKRTGPDGFPYHRRSFEREGRLPLEIAAAWLGKMGQMRAAVLGTRMVEQLQPGCVAMCGICAGMRGETALGDVIVADRIWPYDEGKLVAKPGEPPALAPDFKTYDLPARWSRHAADLKRDVDLASLQELRPPSKEAQLRWLLHAEYAHEAEGGPIPDDHEQQPVACPDWTETFDLALAKKLTEPARVAAARR